MLADVAATAISAVDIALWDLKARPGHGLTHRHADTERYRRG
jgi:hypothetical protein